MRTSSPISKTSYTEIRNEGGRGVKGKGGRGVKGRWGGSLIATKKYEEFSRNETYSIL